MVQVMDGGCKEELLYKIYNKARSKLAFALLGVANFYYKLVQL